MKSYEMPIYTITIITIMMPRITMPINSIIRISNTRQSKATDQRIHATTKEIECKNYFRYDSFFFSFHFIFFVSIKQKQRVSFESKSHVFIYINLYKHKWHRRRKKKMSNILKIECGIFHRFEYLLQILQVVN